MWNHRVCKETVTGGMPQSSGEPLVEYTIREVFYNSDGGVCAVTENNPPIGVYATDEHFPPEEKKPSEEEILLEMAETINRFKRALTQPILDIDTIEWAKWDSFQDEDEE